MIPAATINNPKYFVQYEYGKEFCRINVMFVLHIIILKAKFYLVDKKQERTPSAYLVDQVKYGNQLK